MPSPEEQEFLDTLKFFDPMYHMTDDSNTFRYQEHLHSRLLEMAKTLDPKFVERARNDMVNRNVAEPYRDQYYWSVK